MGKATDRNGRTLKQSKMSKATDAESSISERPISPGPRRLAEWVNPTSTKKVHSLVDKVYKRIWSHRFKRWRNTGWKRLPEVKLYYDYGLVNLIYLIPSIKPKENILMKARCGKTARRV